MGTYTTNKELYIPTVGETGWGTLVNGNFETIDNFLKPIAVSGSTYTFTGNHVGNQSGGSVSATSVSNSGTLTQTGTSTFTGKITANGGIGTTSLTTSSTITSTGKITGNGGIVGTTGTFSGVVSATDFNRTSVHTVTSANPNTAESDEYMNEEYVLIFVLPNTDANYTGNIKIYNVYTPYSTSLRTRLGSQNGLSTFSIESKSTNTLSFTNVDSVYIWCVASRVSYTKIGKVSLT